MTVKYASGTIFYNDYNSLKRCLESLHDKVDLMICVDGRFKHFVDSNAPDASGLSYDGSRELVTSYDNAVLIDVPNSYEIEKRTAYLKECERVNASYLLICDSDEYVYEPETDWVKFDRKVDEFCNSAPFGNYNIFGIYTEIHSANYDHIVHKITGNQKPHLSTLDKRKWSYHPRLWQRPWEMEYNGTHYFFRHKNPSNPLHNQECNATVIIIPHLKLGHDHLYRSKEFLESRLGYQKFLVKFEQNKLRRWMEIYHKLPENYDEIDNWDPPSAEEALRLKLVTIR